MPMWIYYTNFILDSSNIFSYAAKIKDNVDEWFSVGNLKSSYDQLRLLQHNYDKLLWVSVNWIVWKNKRKSSSF